MLYLKKLIAVMAISLSTLSTMAQSEIRLPEPSHTGGLSIMESLWARQSSREFDTRMLSDTDLSDMLFAACGINRPETAHITSPTALNTQEIDVYVFTAKGVYRYAPQGHKLIPVADGDHRALIAGTPEFSQDFVMQAPVSLLAVANPQKFDRMPEMAQMMAIADAGILTENICLFCAGRSLAAVPRATMDRTGIARLLNLPAEAIPALNIPVGYPK